DLRLRERHDLLDRRPLPELRPEEAVRAPHDRGAGAADPRELRREHLGVEHVKCGARAPDRDARAQQRRRDFREEGLRRVGSKSETCPGWMLPLPATPRPPCRIAPRSVRMSPNMLFVTITPKLSGAFTICIAIASAKRWSAVMSGYCFARSKNTRCQRPCAYW